MSQGHLPRHICSSSSNRYINLSLHLLLKKNPLVLTLHGRLNRSRAISSVACDILGKNQAWNSSHSYLGTSILSPNASSPRTGVSSFSASPSSSSSKAPSPASSASPQVIISPHDHKTQPIWNTFELNSVLRLHLGLQKNIRSCYHRLSPIQAHCIPLLIATGKDVMACAQTGSGKTAMFLIPAIHSLLTKHTKTREAKVPSPTVVILAPTRELALQIHNESLKLSQGTAVFSAVAFGGGSARDQLHQLRSGCQILVATPGRLQDFVDRGQVNLKRVAVFVVDEADRMLDMGFEPQLRNLSRQLSHRDRRQTIMCSATFPESIQRLASSFLQDDYYFVTVGRVGSIPDQIQQNFQWVEDDRKLSTLTKVLNSTQLANVSPLTLIFVNTRDDATKVFRHLQRQGYNCGVIHGNLAQETRNQTLKRFKNKNLNVLIGTDIAARGLDVSGIGHVIQYDVGKDVDTYVHRIGRTGRAGAKGLTTSFMNGKNMTVAFALKNSNKARHDQLPLWLHGLASYHAALTGKELSHSNGVGSSSFTSTLMDESDSANSAQNFGGQDFRRSALAGTWGSSRDMRYENFDEQAYMASTESVDEANVRAPSPLKQEYMKRGFHVLNPIIDGYPEGADKVIEPAILEAAEALRMGKHVVSHCHSGLGRGGILPMLTAAYVSGKDHMSMIEWVNERMDENVMPKPKARAFYQTVNLRALPQPEKSNVMNDQANEGKEAVLEKIAESHSNLYLFPPLTDCQTGQPLAGRLWVSCLPGSLKFDADNQMMNVYEQLHQDGGLVVGMMTPEDEAARLRGEDTVQTYSNSSLELKYQPNIIPSRQFVEHEPQAPRFLQPIPDPDFLARLSAFTKRSPIKTNVDSILSRDSPHHQLQRLLRNDGSSQQLFFEYNAMFPPSTLIKQSKHAEYLSSLPTVLMVAEKPSVAEAIADILSSGRMRRRRGISPSVPVFEFEHNSFHPASNQSVCIRVTSVVGHIFTMSFTENEDVTEGDQSQPGFVPFWRRCNRNPELYFDCRTTKQIESTTDKLRIIEHLQQEAQGVDYLALWLDCDREGENIAHEVMSVLRNQFPTNEHTYRARFSSITQKDIENAFSNLQRPNPLESMAVDARQELDLRVGVAFSRYLSNKYRNGTQRQVRDQSIKTISYGPCQAPCLYFVVSKYLDILRYKPQRYWKIEMKATIPQISSSQESVWKWAQGPTFNEQEARQAYHQIQSSMKDRTASCNLLEITRIKHVRETQKTKHTPVGLNTVQLLVSCSKALGMSPKKAMQVAEGLYSRGYISYPRTETTQYPRTFDIMSILRDHCSHPNWGRIANSLLNNRVSVPKEGKSVGDHPPITPIKSASRQDMTPQEWRVYEFVCRYFLGTLLPQAEYRHIHATAQLDSLPFYFRTNVLDKPGHCKAMKWVKKDILREDLNLIPEGIAEDNKELRKQLLVDEDDDNYVNMSNNNQRGSSYTHQKPYDLQEGMDIEFKSIRLIEKQTQPPKFLQEHELVALMDKHRIGTDASMSQHIQNIQDRKYVVVVDQDGEELRHFNPNNKSKYMQKRQIGRYLVPTSLGVNLLEGFSDIDADLVEPPIRAMMESEVSQIANGQVDKNQVMTKNLDWFRKRFRSFVKQEAKMKRQMLRLQPIRNWLQNLRGKGLFGTNFSSPSQQSQKPKTRQRRGRQERNQKQNRHSSNKNKYKHRRF